EYNSNNNSKKVYADVDLVDAQGRPFSGATGTLYITDDNHSETVLLNQQSRPGVYGNCGNKKYDDNGHLTVTFTINGGGCPTVNGGPYGDITYGNNGCP